eukprot:gene329-9988_t
MAAQGAFSKESLAAQNYKEFILLYNKIAEKCFQDCVTSFNETTLTENELTQDHSWLTIDYLNSTLRCGFRQIECTNKCSGKMVNVNHRLMAVFMEIGPPVDKQLGLSGAGMGLM